MIAGINTARKPQRKDGIILDRSEAYIGVLIDGPYVDELNDNISIRGSSNQNIYILKDSLSERYRNVDKWKRESQLVLSDNRLYAIGIPHLT